MARIFFLGIAFYLAYRLLCDLILPVYKTTKHMRQQFSKMQDSTSQPENNTQQQASNKTTGRPAAKPKAGDYIDFEEMK